MEGKELIWVSKDLAQKYKDMDGSEELEMAVRKVIEKKRLDLEGEQELLSESLLMFKSVCLAHKRELEKAYQVQADNIYSLWEEMGDVSSLVGQHAKAIAAQIDPIRREISETKKTVDELKRALQSLDLYVPQQLAAVTEQVARMDEKTKALLSTLLNHKEHI